MSCPGCVETEQTGVCCGVSGSFVHMPQEFAFAYEYTPRVTTSLWFCMCVNT